MKKIYCFLLLTFAANIAFVKFSHLQAQTFQVGIGKQDASWISPYQPLFKSCRNQFLIKASELSAAGISAGNINSIGFNVISGAGETLTGFTIKIGITTATSLSGGWISGLVTVYSAASYTTATGINMHNFSSAYTWNGTSNLVIETCFNNSASGLYGFVSVSKTSYTSSIKIYSYTTGVCSSTLTPDLHSERPNIYFNVTGGGSCTSPPVAGTTIANYNNGCSAYLRLSGISSGNNKTYQWQRSMDSTTWSSISGATYSYYNANNINGVPNYYRCLVTCNAVVSYSTSLLISGNPLNICYCFPLSAGCSNDYISNVSDGVTTNTSGCGKDGYQNFTNIILTAVKAEVNPFTVVSQPNTLNKYIWVDWNKDGDFDDSDENQDPNVGIIPPVSASANQQYVLRVSLFYNSCSSAYYYNDTEDYLLNVTPALSCSTPYNLSHVGINTDSIKINWQYANTLPSNGFLIRYRKVSDSTNVSTWLNPSNTFNTFFRLSTLSNAQFTQYIIEVAADCGINGVGNYSISFYTSTQPLPFIQLDSYTGTAIEGDGIQFNYTNSSNVTNINWYYNGILDRPNVVNSSSNYVWVPIPERGVVTFKAESASDTSVFSEIIVNVLPQNLSITYPINGEELLTGGSANKVQWTASQPINFVNYNNVLIEYEQQPPTGFWNYFDDYNAGQLGTTNSSTNSLNSLAAGEYLLRITPDYGSGNSTTLPFKIKDALILYPNGGEEIKQGNTLTIEANSNISGLYTLQFSSDGGISWTNIKTNFSVNGYSTHNWVVPNVKSNNCYFRLITTGGIVVDQSNSPFSIRCNIDYFMSTLSSTLICQGDSVLLNAASGSGYTYQWKLNGNNIIGATSINYAANQTGTYSVLVSSNGCSELSNSISVNVKPLPVAALSIPLNPSICMGDSLILTAAFGASYYYQWKLNGNAIPGAVASSYYANQAGVYSVDVTENVYGCKEVSNLVSINITPLPVAAISIQGATNFCEGDSVLLNAGTGAGYTYQWKINGNDIAGVTNSSYYAHTGGSYSVQITEYGCSATSSVINVVVKNLPLANLIPASNQACQGDSILLSGNQGSGLTYQWKFNNLFLPFEISQNYFALQSGTYVLIVTEDGCEQTSSPVFLTFNSLPTQPVLSFSNSNSTFCLGDTLVITSSYPTNNLWSTGELSSSIAVTNTNTIYCIHTDSNGCKRKSTIHNLFFNTLPTEPTITQNGDSLFSDYPTGNQWYFNNTILPNDTENVLVPTIFGSYSVCYTRNDGCENCSPPFLITGTNELSKVGGYFIFPNPTSGNLTLINRNPRKLKSEIRLYDYMGKLLYTLDTNEEVINLDLEFLLNGIYILQVKNGEGKAYYYKLQRN